MANNRRSSGEVRPYVRSSKPRFNWTSDLKRLFDDAVIALGDPRKATPKQIRDLMRCPDIQLSHIKSRLQMCRIRMEEKERNSGSNSSEELQARRMRKAVHNADANGEENGVVVDENEPNDAAPSLSMPSSSSLEYQTQHQFLHPSPQSDEPSPKRLRVEAQSTPSNYQSIQGIYDVATTQYYFDYFGPCHEWRAVELVPHEFSCEHIFREEQSNAPKNQEKSIQDHKQKQEASREDTLINDGLQLSLSLSVPGCTKTINLDLTMTIP